MNNVRSIENLKDEELKHGIIGGISKGSWHEKYKDSAWVFIGGFSYELTEGDLICVMSQWGEIEDIHLVREQETNKSKGFAFVKYEDSRSTILAVDNFNGIKLLGRTMRCDHVENYKLPKHIREQEEEKLKDNPTEGVALGPGHAYQGKELASKYTIKKGMDLWGKAINKGEEEESSVQASLSQSKKQRKEKKENKEKKHKEKKEKKAKHSKEDKSDHYSDRDREGKSRRQSSDRESDDDSRRGRKRTRTEVSVPDQPAAIRRPDNNAVTSQSFVPQGEVASWRGNRDPSLRPPMPSKGIDRDSGLTEKKRDELSGIGGFNRLR